MLSVFRKRRARAITGFALVALVIATVIEYPFVSAWLYQRHLAAVAETTQAWPHYGIAAGGSLPDMSPQELDSYMSGLQTLGAGWVRFDFDWSKIQPDSKDSYDWSTYDQIVKSAAAHHLKIIGLIDFTPAWARPSDCQDQKQCAPANPHSYAAFSATLVSRYHSRGVRVWEIWNEPNTQTFWQPAPSTSKYSLLLKAASKAIHQTDSNAIVLSASLAPASTSSNSVSPADFLKALYADGDKPYFDAVGDHPYTFPVTPDTSVNQAWAQMAVGPGSLRAIMVANGDVAKKIWITEFGAPTGGPGPQADVSNLNLGAHPWHVTEALQAEEFRQALTLYQSYDFVGPFLIYSYRDAGTSQQTSENFFGLVRSDGTQKPAYAVAHAAFTKP